MTTTQNSDIITTMRLKIIGKHRIVKNKEVRSLVRWLGKELRIDNYTKPIYIDFKFVKQLKIKTGGFGWCIWEDSNYRPRDFSIECDTIGDRKFTIGIIIHEMVHVAQYAKGRMVDLVRGLTTRRWCGKLIDEDKVPYRKLPWEEEAYRLEKELAKKWLIHNNKNRRQKRH